MNYFYSLLLLATIGLNAQVAPQWSARFNGAGDFNDKVNCMTQDPSGNRYLGGYSLRPGNEKDFLVLKIDLNGDTLWTRTFDGSNHGNDEALDIAYDANGFVLVAGYREGVNTNNDLFVVKLNLQGDTAWTRSYNNVTNQDDQASAVAVSANGTVVVTGWTDLDAAATTTNQDYLTISYSSAGVQNWIATYNGFNNTNDYAVDVIIQSSGNAVVTGKAKNTNDDFVTRAYSTTGAVVWTKVMDGGGGKDKAYEMVQDNAGNIIVTGECNNGNDYDYGVVKYTSTGTELWRNFYDNGAGDDYPQGIAVDVSGNIFITGKCDVDPLLPVVNDLVTVAYNSTGTQQWATPFNGSGNGSDEGMDIATDASGNIFVTGKTDMNSSTTFSDYDMITLKYNASGSIQWQKITGNTLDDDGGVAVLTDAGGNCIAAGNIINAGTMKDIRYIKYSPAGTAIWTKNYAGPGDHTDKVNAMTADAAGNSYMCGYTYSPSNRRDWCVIKVTSIGDTAWVKMMDGTGHSDDEATGIAVDASGNVYVTGSVKDSINSNNYCTVKYNSAGIVQWSTQYNNNLVNGSDKATALLLNSAGEIFVTGESDVDPSASNDKDFVTIKYSNAGTQLWLNTFSGAGGMNDKPYAMSFSPAGDIVVVGKVAVTATNDDAVAVKYSSAGALLWSFVFQNTNGNDVGVAVAQDYAGDVAVAIQRTNAALNYDIGLGRLDVSGNDLGDVSYNGTGNDNDRPSSIAFDASGNIFVTGETDVDANATTANYDIITIKFDPYGVQQWVKTIAGAAGDDDNGVSILIDNPTGYAYVAAQVQNGTLSAPNNNILLIQYDPAGNQQMLGEYDGTSQSDGPAGMSIVNGNIYIAGTSVGANNDQKDMVMLLFSTFQVGIASTENQNAVAVYPNPCSTFTEVHFANTSANRTISLIDVTGKIIFTENANAALVRVETAQLAKGIYYGTISEEGKTPQTIKIIVQ